MNNNNWRTPKAVFDALNQLFSFELDAAASDHNALCPVYLTEEINSLVTPWVMFIRKGGNTWCNPPYSKIMPWVLKASDEQRNQVGTVMLVFNDPGAGWFLHGIKTACEVWHVVGGRMAFGHPDTGIPGRSNDRPSVIFIWHPISQRVGEIKTRYVTRDSLIAGGDLEFV